MYRKSFVLFAAIGVALLALPRTARAQGSPPENGAIVHPADDGYNVLVAAYAALHEGSAIKQLIEIEDDDFARITLTEKRGALRDPAARNALSLQQTALGKPRLDPPRVMDFGYRDPLRLLLLQQYVQFADGKTAAGIDTLADAFQIADALTASGSFGRSFGNGIKLQIIAATALRLDQLSASDCSRLVFTVHRELAQADPFLAELEADRKYQHDLVDIKAAVKPVTFDSDVERTLDLERQGYVSNNEREEAGRFLASNPAAAEMLATSISRRIDAYYDDMATRYAAYPTVPPAMSEPPHGSAEDGSLAMNRLASRVVMHSTLTPNSVNFQIEKMMRIRACERLLAVHAAISAYRWENDRLPSSLADLKLRDLAQDPFSNRPFIYTRKNDREYKLESIGYPKRDSDANPVPGARSIPIDLLPAATSHARQ